MSRKAVAFPRSHSLSRVHLGSGKTLLLCPPGSADGVWRNEVDLTEGEWRKPSEVGLPKMDVTVPRAFTWHAKNTDSYERRLDLRRELSQRHDAALIMGVPEEKYLDTFEIGDDHHRIATKQRPRTGKTCVDAPRGWLTLDIDDLDLRLVDPDFDVIADDEKLADLLFEAFDRMGLG